MLPRKTQYLQVNASAPLAARGSQRENHCG